MDIPGFPARKAALHVCSALGKDDALPVLQALGLVGYDAHDRPVGAGEHAKRSVKVRRDGVLER